MSDLEFPLAKEVESYTGHCVALYTDGGCRGNPGPGAYAYMVQAKDGEVLLEDAKFDPNTTNNKMELSAVIAAIESLPSISIGQEVKVYVYSDSKYVVDGMNAWVAGWKARGWKKADKKTPNNLELWQRLDELSQSYKIDFLWVKGHSGHPQNDWVDQLANRAMDEALSDNI